METVQERIGEVVRDVEGWLKRQYHAGLYRLGESRYGTEADRRKDQEWEACRGPLADKVRELAANLAKNHREAATGLFQLAALVKDGSAHDSRPDHPCVTKVLESLKPELDYIAALPVPTNAPEVDELVTLGQVAPLTGLSKRTLERYIEDGDLPEPDRPGGGGRSHKWYWGKLRPALERISKKHLPVQFPGARIISHTGV